MNHEIGVLDSLRLMIRALAHAVARADDLQTLCSEGLHRSTTTPRPIRPTNNSGASVRLRSFDRRICGF